MSYEYDHEDRLVAMDIPADEPVSFHYDQDGMQRARVINEGIPGSERITRYFSSLVHTTAQGKTTRRYFLGATLIASREIADTSWQLVGGPTFGDPGSGVEFASASWEGRPILVMSLAPGVQVVAAVATLLLLAAVLVLPATKRRGLGVRVRRGPVVIVVALFVCGSTPGGGRRVVYLPGIE